MALIASKYPLLAYSNTGFLPNLSRKMSDLAHFAQSLDAPNTPLNEKSNKKAKISLVVTPSLNHGPSLLLHSNTVLCIVGCCSY